jgi:uncharacterized protein (DUF1697 family)
MVPSAMPQYAALLRGVSPLNAKMPALKKAFEAAGFEGVKTVLGSGNVVFASGSKSITALEKKAEQAMQAELGKAFPTIVRPIDELEALLEKDPFAKFELEPKAKRVVTFMKNEPKAKLKVPISLDGAHILLVKGQAVFSAYVPSPKGPVFMTLIEKTFGKEVTTRTWDTVTKIVKAARK